MKKAQIELHKAGFLSAYAQTGGIQSAAAVVGVDRRRHYNWLREDPEYAERFADAQQQFIELMEAEADRRGALGVDEPVFQGGKQVGTKRKYSDTLLMFRLNASAPDKYKYRSHVTQETNIKADLAVKMQDMSPQQQRERAIQTVATLRELGVLQDESQPRLTDDGDGSTEP